MTKTKKLEVFLRKHRPETISSMMRWDKNKGLKDEIIQLMNFLYDHKSEVKQNGKICSLMDMIEYGIVVIMYLWVK